MKRRFAFSPCLLIGILRGQWLYLRRFGRLACRRRVFARYFVPSNLRTGRNADQRFEVLSRRPQFQRNFRLQCQPFQRRDQKHHRRHKKVKRQGGYRLCDDERFYLWSWPCIRRRFNVAHLQAQDIYQQYAQPSRQVKRTATLRPGYRPTREGLPFGVNLLRYKCYRDQRRSSNLSSQRQGSYRIGHRRFSHAGVRGE